MFEFDSNSEMMFEFEFEFFMLTLNFHVFNLGMTYTVFGVDSIENDQIALNLWNKLESQRIAKEQAEKARLAKVAEDQRLAEIEAERLRIELSEKAEAEKIAKEKAVKEAAEQMEKQRVEKAIPLISSLLPLTGIGILLLYSRGGKF